MKNSPGSHLRRQTGYSIFLKQECDRLKKIHGKGLGGKSFLFMAVDAWRLLPQNDRQVEKFITKFTLPSYIYNNNKYLAALLKGRLF